MLGNAASIATLILFVIYFIGRGITVCRMRDLEQCSIEVKDYSFDHTEYQIVEEYPLDIDFTEEEPFGSAIIITSANGIYSFRIYEYEFDNDMNVVGKKTIVSRDKLINIGQSVVFYSYIPELIARYEIVYRTADFRKICFPVVDNLKSGVITESLVPHHTIRSVLYYLFR